MKNLTWFLKDTKYKYIIKYNNKNKIKKDT